jgi:hypothetical protein
MKVNDLQSGSILSDLDNHNLMILGYALRNIRMLATEGLNGYESTTDSLRNISLITDMLHNVPGMMIYGQACDADALLHGASHWPTGIDENGSILAVMNVFDVSGEKIQLSIPNMKSTIVSSNENGIRKSKSKLGNRG